MSFKIITQEGVPIGEDIPEEKEPPVEEFQAAAEDVANDILKSFRKFKNGTIFKIGLIAVAVKIVGVTGQIIIENQRLKAALKDRQQEREQGDEKK